MMIRLAKILILASCFLVPLFAISIDSITPTVREEFALSAEVWSDDFNDLNADDWEIYGWTGTDGTALPGNFSLSEGMLRIQGVDTQTSIAIYNTTQATGMWSFDLDVTHTIAEHFYVSFFGGYWDNDSVDWGAGFFDSIQPGYGIMPVTGPFGDFDNEFVFYQRDQGSASLSRILGRYSPTEIIGWHHFDIARDASGRFYVYLNGTLRMSSQDTVHTTTECFKFYSAAGPALDNVVLYDNWPVDQVAPSWTQSPINQIVDEGVPFEYDLNATDHNGIDTWLVNDTTHFAIDANGVIINAIVLSPNTYWLEVSVNDTLDNTQTAEFSVTVNPTTPPPDLLIFALIGGGALAVIVVVVVIRRRS